MPGLLLCCPFITIKLLRTIFCNTLHDFFSRGTMHVLCCFSTYQNWSYWLAPGPRFAVQRQCCPARVSPPLVEQKWRGRGGGEWHGHHRHGWLVVGSHADLFLRFVQPPLAFPRAGKERYSRR